MNGTGDISEICIPPDMPVGDALDRLDRTHRRILFITTATRYLLGVVTDPDFRRAMLMRIDFSRPIADIMTQHPVVAHIGMNDREILALMERCNCHGVPVVDQRNLVVRLVQIQDIIAKMPHPTGRMAIIMAGGLGERLRPLTEQTPKPLLSVGGKPILFTILDRLLANHFDRVYIALNYMADSIRTAVMAVPHYRDAVCFLEEEQQLGTCGAISLLPERPKDPFVVMNGDLLTNIALDEMLSMHAIEDNHLTMALHEEQITLPYGIVSLEASRVTGLREKPAFTHFVNAGMYVVDPRCLDLVEHSVRMDMTDLIDRLIARNQRVGGFLVREYWLDIGLPHQLEQARRDYSSLFKDPEPPAD